MEIHINLIVRVRLLLEILLQSSDAWQGHWCIGDSLVNIIDKRCIVEDQFRLFFALNPYCLSIITGMSCPSWQWHRTGSRWSPVRTLLVAPLWCDLGFVPNSRGNKAAANLRPASEVSPLPVNSVELEIKKKDFLECLLS